MATGSNESVECVDVLSRSGHIAVLADKLMLIWGGYTEHAYAGDRYLPSQELNIYHTNLNFWTRHITKGDIPPGTSGASGYLVKENLYVFAGHTEEGNSNSLYRLDLHTLTWTDLTPQDDVQLQAWPSPRDKFSSWSMENKLFCFGGYGVPINDFLYESGVFQMDLANTYRGWNNQLMVYDIETGIWSNPKCKGPLPLPRAAHAAVQFNKKVYIFGGRHGDRRMNDLHCLDLEIYTWSGELHMEGAYPCGRSWHTLTAVSDNVAFLYGGYSCDGKPLSDAWQLNAITRQWTQVTVPPDRARLWHTSSCTDDGEILVYGGCCSDILQLDEPTVQPKDVLSFHLHPYKLQRLCIEAAYNFKDITQKDWCALPKRLSDLLLRKLKVDEMKKLNKSVLKNEKVGSTCTLS